MDPNIKSGTSILSPLHEIHSTETKLEPIPQSLAKSIDKVDHVAEVTIHASDPTSENSTEAPHSLDLLNSYHANKLQNDLLNQFNKSSYLDNDDLDIDFDMDIDQDMMDDNDNDFLQTVDYKDAELEEREDEKTEIKEVNEARIDTVTLGEKVVSARIANVYVVDLASIKNIDTSKLSKLTDDLDKGSDALKTKMFMEVDFAAKKAYVPRGSGIKEGTEIEVDGVTLTVSYMTEEQERSLLENWDLHVTTQTSAEPAETKQEVQEKKTEETKHKSTKGQVDNAIPTRNGKEKEIVGGWVNNHTFSFLTSNSDAAKVEHRKNEESALEHDIENEERQKEIRKEHIRKGAQAADDLKQYIAFESQHNPIDLGVNHRMVIVPPR